jgi:hypothetical protein
MSDKVAIEEIMQAWPIMNPSNFLFESIRSCRSTLLWEEEEEYEAEVLFEN